MYFSLFFILNSFYINHIPFNKFFKKKLKLPKQKDIKVGSTNSNLNEFLCSYGFFLKNNQIKDLINFFNNIFFSKTNCLFIDFDFNFNYLPITNNVIFNRNNRLLLKFVKYFNVSTLVFFNVNKKLFIFNKLSSYKLINISVNNDLKNTKMDFCVNLPNTRLHNYLLYCLISNIYIKNKH